jgi:RNA 2',3'-cyclic 3'-phosphodiesterase
MIRAFVAVLLDEATRAALGAQIARLRDEARGVGWVPPDNLHVTLKFLGRVEPARLPAIGAALAGVAAGAGRFDLDVRGLGAFPTPTRPRVIWAGIGRGAEPLAALAGGVERGLAGLGFAPEDRPFSAHVTLGRVREPRRDPALAAALGAGGGRPFGTVRVARLSLMQSHLSPAGARYTELDGWSLDAARAVRFPW